MPARALVDEVVVESDALLMEAVSDKSEVADEPALVLWLLAIAFAPSWLAAASLREFAATAFVCVRPAFAWEDTASAVADELPDDDAASVPPISAKASEALSPAVASIFSISALATDESRFAPAEELNISADASLPPIPDSADELFISAAEFSASMIVVGVRIITEIVSDSMLNWPVAPNE
jgi:hypothetical protein